MNDQNVQNLVDYIKKNNSIPSGQLEEAVVKAGYLKEQFCQALELAGNSQISNPVIPSVLSVNPQAMMQDQHVSFNKKPFLLIASILIMVLILVGSIILYILKNKSRVPVKISEQSNGNEQITLSNKISGAPPGFNSLLNSNNSTGELSNNQPSGPAIIDNPMKIFVTALSSADYKVSSSGKIENKKQDGTGNQISSLDLNNGIIYIQKGSVVRADKTDPLRPEVGILKGDKVYGLNQEKKTYFVLNITDEMGKFYSTALKGSFPLISLSDDTQKGIVHWLKTRNNEWQGDWKWKTPLDQKETPAKVKIFLDPKINLITTLSIRFMDSQPWQEAMFTYEKIRDIEGLLIPPSGYKEEKFTF